jgi:hypothetical protein
LRGKEQKRKKDARKRIEEEVEKVENGNVLRAQEMI